MLNHMSFALVLHFPLRKEGRRDERASGDGGEAAKMKTKCTKSEEGSRSRSEALRTHSAFRCQASPRQLTRVVVYVRTRDGETRCFVGLMAFHRRKRPYVRHFLCRANVFGCCCRLRFLCGNGTAGWNAKGGECGYSDVRRAGGCEGIQVWCLRAVPANHKEVECKSTFVSDIISNTHSIP